MAVRRPRARGRPDHYARDREGATIKEGLAQTMQGADYRTVLDRPYVQKEGLNYIGRNHMGHNYIRFVQKEVRWTQQYDKPSAFFFLSISELGRNGERRGPPCRSEGA